MKNKILILAIALVVSFGILGSTNVEAKTYKHCVINKSKKSCYYGYSPRNASYKWRDRKIYTYSSSSRKTLIKYDRTKRDSKLRFTSRQIKYYSKKKTVMLKDYKSFGYVKGKWSNKYYRLVKYNNGKTYYSYTQTKRSNGSRISTIVFSNKVWMKYNYNSSNAHVSTYKFVNGSWTKTWSAPVPEYASEKFIADTLAGLESYEKDGWRITFQARSNSDADKKKADALFDKVDDYRWDVLSTAGYIGYPIRLSNNTNNKTGISYAQLWFNDHSDGKEMTKKLADYIAEKEGLVVRDNVIFVK